MDMDKHTGTWRDIYMEMHTHAWTHLHARTHISTERCKHGYTWRNTWMRVQAQTHKGTTRKMHKKEQHTCAEVLTLAHTHTTHPDADTWISRDVHTHTNMPAHLDNAHRDACEHGCMQWCRYTRVLAHPFTLMHTNACTQTYWDACTVAHG